MEENLYGNVGLANSEALIFVGFKSQCQVI